MTKPDATEEDELFDAQCAYFETLSDIDDSTENGEKLFIFKRGMALERARVCREYVFPYAYGVGAISRDDLEAKLNEIEAA